MKKDAKRRWMRRLVRWLSAWAWSHEIRKAKDFERVRDDKWRYRVALENVLESATPNKRDNPKMHAAWQDADAALYPPNAKIRDAGERAAPPL